MREDIAKLLAHFPDGLVVLGGLAAGLLLKTVLFAVLRAYDQREDSALARSVCEHLSAASAFFLPVLALSLLPLLPLPPKPFEVLRRVV